MKKYTVCIFLLILLSACSEEITSDYLIGGEWKVIGKYEDGELVGEPELCRIVDGLEFINEDTVNLGYFDREFDYEFEEGVDGTLLTIRDDRNIFTFLPDIINDNELGLESILEEDMKCYYERQ